jgi:SAM-dependent methyltransferase
MLKQTLEQLYAVHNGKVSDKWNSYLSQYERLFSPYRNEPIRLLEIGVQNGGSLEIWGQYFSNAEKLVGCDINPLCAKLTYTDPRVAIIIGDANTDIVQSAVMEQSAMFDVIIDDGSHHSGDIVKAFSRYFPLLKDGGVFIAEDLHCSYWAEFDGGLFDPLSSIAFFKRLADIVNFEHWGCEKSRTDILQGFFSKFSVHVDEEQLGLINAVEFVNSICVIRKQAAEHNQLNERFIAGHDDLIVSVNEAIKVKTSLTPSQTENEWTARSIPPDEDVIRLEKSLLMLGEELWVKAETISELDKQIQYFEKEIAQRDDQIAILLKANTTILNSTIWRLTLPLRIIGNGLKGVLRYFSR